MHGENFAMPGYKDKYPLGGGMLARNKFVKNFQCDTKNDSSLSLENGSRIAVVGGGPAGSFLAALYYNLQNVLTWKLVLIFMNGRIFQFLAQQDATCVRG